ncbi:MAG: hypothetical protein ACYC3F_13435 [Gemmatimonadaceae bacterium]
MIAPRTDTRGSRRLQAPVRRAPFPLSLSSAVPWRWARHVVTAAALASALGSSACGGGDGSSGSTAPVKDPNVLGSAGGTIQAGNGAVTLSVPAGALSAEVKLTATPRADPAGDTRTSVGTPYEFGPEGTKFLQPVTLTFKYDKSKLPAGAAQSEMKLAQYSSAGWVPMEDGFAIDSVNGTVKIAVSQLGGATSARLRALSEGAVPGGSVSSLWPGSWSPIWGPFYPPINSCETVTIGENQTLTGGLNNGDCQQTGNNGRRSDFYSVTTTGQSLLSVNVSGAVAGPFGLQAKGLAAYSSSTIGGNTLNTVVPAGTWMIFVTGQDSAARGAYTIKTTSTPYTVRSACEALNIVKGQTVAGRVDSGAGSADCSAVIPQSEPNAAHRGQTTYYDFYRVRLFAGKTYTVTVTPGGAGNPCMAVWLGNTLVVPWTVNGQVTRSATITPTADLYYGLEVESCSTSLTAWSPVPTLNYTISVTP